MKKIIVLGLVLIFGGRTFAQQQPMYSQYMFNMLNINPAYAGNRDVGNVNFLLRKQWVNFNGAPTTGSVSYDQRLMNKNFSLGGQIYFDQISIEKSTGVQGFYSYSAPFEKSTLSLGMSFGVLNYNINYSRTNPFMTGDPGLQRVVNNFLPTAGIGALWSSEKWYVGLSAPALLRTKMNEKPNGLLQSAGAEGHFFLTGGYMMNLNDQVVVKPSFLIKSVSGAPVQADFNVNFWFNSVVGAALSYRTQEAVVGMLELQVTPQLRLGYAYDHNISTLANYINGTHEMMLRYEFGGMLGKMINSPRYY